MVTLSPVPIIKVTSPHKTPWFVYGAKSHKVSTCSMLPDDNTTSAHRDGLTTTCGSKTKIFMPQDQITLKL